MYNHNTSTTHTPHMQMHTHTNTHTLTQTHRVNLHLRAETFPMLSPALHHNNCMYLAHHLLTLGHQFKHSLPSDVSATFVDLIPEIRGLGTSSFLDQMNMQKAILEQYIQEAAGIAWDVRLVGCLLL